MAILQWRWMAAVALAAGAAALPGLAVAGSVLTLAIGGAAYDGPPQFAVSFDGKPIGQGTVAAAIDTASAGRFVDAADKAKYTQIFSFPIADDVFRPDGVVAIRLLNEARSAAGGADARVLYVHLVGVNGDELPGTALSMRSDAGVEPTAVLGDYLVVAQNAVEGIALPSGGWPAAQQAAASAPAPAAAPDVASAPVAAPTAAAQVEPAALSLDSADANPDPAGGAAGCGVSGKFQVTGFNENSSDLTPRIRESLDAIAGAIGTQKCVVHLTGYSSTEGDFAHNALFSIERSQNALHYLAARGVKFRRFSANGVGETTQFGADPGANRRVVVTVSP